MQIHVLMVEDSEDDALLILRELARGGYEPNSKRVETREDMLAALEQQEWDIILSDFAMPRFSGIHALDVYHSKKLDIPFIVISGTIGEETAVKMMKAGAHDYMMKNNLTRLVPAIQRELEETRARRARRAAELALRQSEERFKMAMDATNDGLWDWNIQTGSVYYSPGYYLMLGYEVDAFQPDYRTWLNMIHPDDRQAAYNANQACIDNPEVEGFEIEFRMQARNGDYKWILTRGKAVERGPDGKALRLLGTHMDISGQKNAAEELRQANINMSNAYDRTIEGWSRALELRERETAGHSLRVVDLTVRLARSAGFREFEIEHIRRGALLHDIGKMGIPDSILLKPGPLTEDEWVIMRQHPRYAYELLADIQYLRPALDIPYFHHEKWDGNGYPSGLKGERIPLSARLFSVVDVWDALTTSRPYRPAWTRQASLDYIHAQSGIHFDPCVVELFDQMIQEESPDVD